MDTFPFALPGRPKLPIGGPRSGHRAGLSSGGRKFLSDVDSTPVSWRQYWTSCTDLNIPCLDASGSGDTAEDVFRVYRRGTNGPLLVLLHGGGYSALTWSLLVEEICNEVPHCQVLAYDQRGHGSTKTQRPQDMDTETLSRDVGRVLSAVFADETMPDAIVLVGHSMGGAIAVHTEFLKHIDVAVAGVVVIDVVEGTAMAALSSMHSVLASRPASFPSLLEAIQWSYRSGQTRNLDAARVSMPGQVKNSETGVCGADEVEQHQRSRSVSESDEQQPVQDVAAADSGEACSEAFEESPGLPALTTTGRFSARRLSCRRLSVDNENKIEEEEEEDGSSAAPQGSAEDRRRRMFLGNLEMRKSFDAKRLRHSASCDSSSVESGKYTWSINLSTTTPHWSGWFEGLSQRFLSIHPPKLLLLAGVDRLDTDLTVGQMQGKFQLQVVGRCGHAVHEDAPDEVAAAIIAFLTRHRIFQPKHPTKFHAVPGC